MLRTSSTFLDNFLGHKFPVQKFPVHKFPIHKFPFLGDSKESK